MKSKTIITLKIFIKLQYNELSSALQFINVPKCPKIPEPIIPPLEGCGCDTVSVELLFALELLLDLGINYIKYKYKYLIKFT